MDNINKNLENQQGASENPVNKDGRVVPPAYPDAPEWTKNILISSTPWPSPEEIGKAPVKLNEPEKITQAAEMAESEAQPYEDVGEKKELPMWLQIGIIAVAAVVLLVMVRGVMNLRKSPETTVPVTDSTVTVTAAATATNAPVSAVQTTAGVTSSVTATTVTTTVKAEKTTAKAEKTTAKQDKTTTASSGKQKNDAEVKRKVIEYFNESSNRVKTEAVKVVKNFENRTHNEEKLQLPSAIKGVAKSILEDKIVDITEPVEYVTAEEIMAKYPAPYQKWSSQLTVDEVEKATCIENGDEYEITIVLKKCVDPEPGMGTSKAMDCLNVPEVRDTAPPFVTSFTAEYYDCVIKCRAEKETGRIIWSNYTTPVVVKVGLDAGFAQFDAQIGLTFEKDYTIIY